MRNFHLPLPEGAYSLLRAEAERSQTTSTALARQAIEWWLKERRRAARGEAIAAYAREAAGSAQDLDPALEAAGVEHLTKHPRKGR